MEQPKFRATNRETKKSVYFSGYDWFCGKAISEWQIDRYTGMSGKKYCEEIDDFIEYQDIYENDILEIDGIKSNVYFETGAFLWNGNFLWTINIPIPSGVKDIKHEEGYLYENFKPCGEYLEDRVKVLEIQVEKLNRTQYFGDWPTGGMS